jgi:hypothetical protein
MSRETKTQILLAAATLGAGLISYQTPRADTIGSWITFGWVAFGLLNAIVAVPGTFWLRIGAVAISVFAVLQQGVIGSAFALLIWLFWPAAFMVAASLGRRLQPPSERRPDPTEDTGARIALAVVVVAVAAGSILFRWLVWQNLQQTAALFVGIPALLALVVVFTVSPRSAIGVACKTVTIGLLVSLVFLGEGILCIALSAPLFYAIAIAIALVIKLARREGKPPVLYSCILVLIVVPMSLEGVTDFTTIDREEVVTVSKVLESSPAAVERALFESPRFDRTIPFLLRAGFPNPVSSSIDRTAGDARWVIRFRGGETRLNGMEPSPGDLILKLEEARPGAVRWRAVSDSSHMTHFLDWREANVQWEAVDAGKTRITWTLKYRRGLDPAWYFGPMERYAVRLAAGYLIDAVATP